MNAEKYLLKMEHINKAFFGVSVLSDVHLTLKEGEVLALLGENGAGKSTLMKVLTGIYKLDSGQIYINENLVTIGNPGQAQHFGITMMHQEICLVPQLSIAENIFLGRERRNKRGMLDKAAMSKHAQKVLDELELELSASSTLERLSVAQQQMVEIAKALAFNAKIIIMDEPTAALTEKEVDTLLTKIGKIKKSGVSVIYISHRMPEIFAVCDTVAVLRDGISIDQVEVKNTTQAELIKMMVGREITDVYGVDERIRGSEEIVLEANNLTNKNIKNISFTLKKGEILGFSGLVGSGRTELSKALYGIDKLDSGEVLINGEKVNVRNPRKAIEKGMALAPEDRKTDGLVQTNSVAFNLTLPIVNRFIRHLRVDGKAEKSIVDTYAYLLSIKMSSPQQHCQNLSGGNQQKVVLSKCMVSEPKILVLDEPTRGIDVGTKSEIYQLIKKLARQGISVIFISSELPEILNVSSRIAVMHEGELMKIFEEDEVKDVTQEMIMYYATGGNAL